MKILFKAGENIPALAAKRAEYALSNALERNGIVAEIRADGKGKKENLGEKERGGKDEGGALIVKYGGKEEGEGIYIPHLEPKSLVEFEKVGGLFALCGTSFGGKKAFAMQGSCAVFSFDILRNLFCHYSCEAEVRLGKNAKRDSYIGELGFAFPIPFEPVVDLLALEIGKAALALDGGREKIKKRWGDARQADRVNGDLQPAGGRMKKFCLALTHDVDYVSKTVLFRAKNAGRRAALASRGIARGDFAGAFSSLACAGRFAIGGGNYWNFEKIMGIEEKAGCTSTFNFHGKTSGKKSASARFYDPDYEVSEKRVSDEMKRICAKGWEVAVHPSYDSLDSKGLFLESIRGVEKETGKKVLGCRQHFLRLDLQKTFLVQEECGLLYDTSLGWNDSLCLRGHTVSPFRAYSWEREEGLSLLEIPLLVMDSTVLDYLGLSEKEARKECFSLLEKVRGLGGCGSILWHPHTFGPDFGWGWLYEEIIEWAGKNGGACMSAAQAAREWKV